MELKVLLIDIDGTLVGKDKTITPYTKEALVRAQKEGLRIVLASGRPVRGMLRYAKELCMDQYHGLLVSYNGAMVTDAQSGEVLYEKTMSVKRGQAVLEHMKKFRVKPMIQKEDVMYVNDVYDNIVHMPDGDRNIIEYEARTNDYILAEKKDLAQFADFPLYKILNAGDPEYLKEHFEEMKAPFDDLACMFTAAMYVEFTAKGIDKTAAIKKVLEPMGYVADSMAAFGDAPNDASMLRYAGTGVAMGNASEDLKKIADECTESCEQDGIARWLYRQFPVWNAE